jgi:hypothetical protein
VSALVPFQPRVGVVFSFQATLDGQQYILSVPWGVAGQRWFLKCTTLSGVVIFLLPLIGSADGITLESVAWSLGKVTLVTSAPHGIKIGTVALLTVSGVAPGAFNGTFPCSAIDEMTLTYPLPGNPGTVTALGLVAYNINIGQGYFSTSSIVFRQSSQNFEVTP